MNTRMLSRLCVMLAAVLLIAGSAHSQVGTRKIIAIPDIKGYQTLKCDFHTHTVFSDGDVWPFVRVKEAWREGLDAISITDHIEYQPHKGDIPTNHNRPYEIAKPIADRENMILIRGTEITRDTPPGHHNAIFVSEIDSLDTPDFYDSIEAAIKQDGFVFYNHPGWKHPERKAEWFEFQEKIYNNGWLHGIEVVNHRDYYPLAHQWAIDKNLTMLGNSDVHGPIEMVYNLQEGEHRPMTLVFAKERSAKGIREALEKRRTAVWYKDKLIGNEEFLAPIFEETLEIDNPTLTITGNNRVRLQFTNTSDIDYILKLDQPEKYITVSGSVTVPAHRTVGIDVRKRPAPKPSDGSEPKEVYGRKKVTIPYTVENLYVKPSTGMKGEFTIRVNFEKAN